MNERTEVRLLTDQELQQTIARMFENWCWISGDPGEKRYYDELLAEVERRSNERQCRRGD